MKHSSSLVLLLTLIGLSLSACNNEGGTASANLQSTVVDFKPPAGVKPVNGLDFKIGIMTGTVSQGEDEYRGAERVIDTYGRDLVIHKTYPDNFMTEQETTVTQLLEVSQDPAVRCIVVAQAVPGTLPAIKKIRRRRPEMLFILVAPQEDPEQVAQYADLILNTDDLLRGKTIVQHSADMGAKTFIHYTFPRHMSIEILARRRDLMREECEKLGLEFVSLNAPDPTGDQGIAGSQKYVLEDVPRQIAEHGKDTAFFSTNCSMQEPLIRAALDGGAIFAEQCCPSPTHGYPGALGISISEDIAGDMGKIREQLSEKIAERGQEGRFGTWLISMHMVMIEAAVELAKGKLHGELELTDMETVRDMLARIGNAQMDITLFNDHENYMMVISENVPL